MKGNPGKAGQDVTGSHTDMSPFLMDMVMGQHGCAGHVQPLQPAFDTQPTLIEMGDRGRDELLADAFQSGVSSGDKLTGGCKHDRLRGGMTVEGSQQLSDAGQGDELLAVQVAGKRLQPWTILGGLGHVGRKRTLYARTTAGALLYLRLMLCHFDAGGRDVEYLPFHLLLGSLRCQLCLAVRAIL